MDGLDAHGLTGISSVPDRKDTTKGTAVKETTFHRTRKRYMGVEVHAEWAYVGAMGCCGTARIFLFTNGKCTGFKTESPI